MLYLNQSQYQLNQAVAVNEVGSSDWSNIKYAVPKSKLVPTKPAPTKEQIIDFIDNFSKHEHFYFSDKNGRKINTMYIEPYKNEVLFVCVSLNFLNTIHDMESSKYCKFLLNINSYNLSVDLSSDSLKESNKSSFDQNYIIVPIKINTFEQTVNYELKATVTIYMNPQNMILNFIQKIEAMPSIYNCLCKNKLE